MTELNQSILSGSTGIVVGFIIGVGYCKIHWGRWRGRRG